MQRATHGAGEASKFDLIGGGQREGEPGPLRGFRVLHEAAKSPGILLARCPHIVLTRSTVS